MDQNRWRAVNEIFDAALELPPSERSGYVSIASGGDPSVVCDVERLLAADELAGGYLETPAAIEFAAAGVPLLPGDVLKRRFRIVRSVGEGGMGKVFEAWDEELKVRVALKVVRPEIASSAATLAAFRREVRIARTITHPNVCRTYDLDRGELTSGDQPVREAVFLTMEFLEGETLAAMLARRGALRLPEALDLAAQIASALDAAHTKGTVHRDIKPANIMLVPLEGKDGGRLRAVITDFGLARAESLQHSVMASSLGGGSPVGTLAYMAPEQMESDGRITPATDVFAFGLVLFEMVTGQRAFPSKNLLSGIAQRLAGPLPSPSFVVPGLPQVWDRAITECLRRDPAERFQSAGAVVEALATGEFFPRTPGCAASTDAVKTARWRGKWSRWTMGAAALLAVVALLATGLRLYRVREDAAVAPGTLVYLAPVMNRTGKLPFDNVTELLRAGLTQSAQINLLDPSRVGDILQTMKRAPETAIDAPVAREIAMRAGAARVVFATVTGGGGKYRLDIDIQRPDPSGVFRYYEHWPKSFPWENGDDAGGSTIPPELAVAVRNATTWVRGEVGESSKDLARLDAPPEDVTTSSWEALEDYNKAAGLARERNMDGATDLLKKALGRDPHFALAAALLGDIEFQQSHLREGYKAYRNALQNGSEERLSLRERDRIKGIIADDMGDFEAAEAAYREYNLYYPDDAVAWFRRGRPLLMLGRPKESIAVLTQAHKRDPERAGTVMQIIRANLVTRDYPEVNRLLEELAHHTSRMMYLYSLGPAQFVQGDYAGAERSFRELSSVEDDGFSLSGVQMLAELKAEQGDYRSASSLLEERLRLTPEANALRLDKAHVECRMGQYEECASDLQRVLAKDDSPSQLIAASQILGREITFASRMKTSGLRDLLRSLRPPGRGLDGGLTFEIAGARIRGEQLLASGDAQGAITQLRRASALDAPFNSREYLARALTVMAGRLPDAAKASATLREAIGYYAQAAQTAGMVWQYPPDYPPGFYADQIEAWLGLASRMSVSDAEREEMLRALTGLRPGAAERLRDRRVASRM